MRVFITGMEGFVGSHLAEYALQQGAEVHGTVYPGAVLANLQGIDGCHTHLLDVRDADAMARLLKRLQPDWIFHLAGQSNVFTSSKIAEQTLAINILGNLNVLEACRGLEKNPRILVVASANEYGKVGQGDLPVRETHPLHPQNPYAISKVCQDLTGQYYYQHYGLAVIRMRPFNHIGPRQSPAFACSDFARQIAEIEAKRQKPFIQVGNLHVQRDFTDVRDIVRGYWLALKRGKTGEVYNICSGKAITIKSLLQGLLVLTEQKIRVIQDPDKIRKKENPSFYGSFSRFRKQTGWSPKIKLTRTLQDTLDYWRKQAG